MRVRDSVCPVRVSVRGPERRPKFGSKSGARCSFERGNPNFFTGRRGFDVTATLLALLVLRPTPPNRAARDARPGRPRARPARLTDACHSRHARSRSHHGHRSATVTPESLQAAGKLPCATTLSSLDAAVVTRVTSFAFPSGGAPTGASLHLERLALSNDGGPGAEYADCADCGPRFPPPPPMCAETCNWASDAWPRYRFLLD